MLAQRGGFAMKHCAVIWPLTGARDVVGMQALDEPNCVRYHRLRVARRGTYGHLELPLS